MYWHRRSTRFSSSYAASTRCNTSSLLGTHLYHGAGQVFGSDVQFCWGTSMLEVQNVERNLARIRLRCRLFWMVFVGGFFLSLVLGLIDYPTAKVVGLMWVIFSIATWMSPMMTHCPRCYKPFYKGWFPAGLSSIQCTHCGISLGTMKKQDTDERFLPAT